MKELKDLSNDELCERLADELRQLKIEATDPRWNGMQRDLVADLDRDAVELAKRLREGELDRLAMDELAERAVVGEDGFRFDVELSGFQKRFRPNAYAAILARKEKK